MAPKLPHPPEEARAQALAELRAIREELVALRKLFDEFAGVFLNARFPYGKPTDRWERPRGCR